MKVPAHLPHGLDDARGRLRARDLGVCADGGRANDRVLNRVLAGLVHAAATLGRGSHRRRHDVAEDGGAYLGYLARAPEDAHDSIADESRRFAAYLARRAYRAVHRAGGGVARTDSQLARAAHGRLLRESEPVVARAWPRRRRVRPSPICSSPSRAVQEMPLDGVGCGDSLIAVTSDGIMRLQRQTSAYSQIISGCVALSPPRHFLRTTRTVAVSCRKLGANPLRPARRRGHARTIR